MWTDQRQRSPSCSPFRSSVCSCCRRPGWPRLLAASAVECWCCPASPPVTCRRHRCDSHFVRSVIVPRRGGSASTSVPTTRPCASCSVGSISSSSRTAVRSTSSAGASAASWPDCSHCTIPTVSARPISLGSPIRVEDPEANLSESVRRLSQLAGLQRGRRGHDLTVIPVPSTVIYSRQDGVVAPGVVPAARRTDLGEHRGPRRPHRTRTQCVGDLGRRRPSRAARRRMGSLRAALGDGVVLPRPRS